MLQRQDKLGLSFRLESFQVESASRRALKELVDHFEFSVKTLQKHIDAVNQSTRSNSKHLEKHDAMMKEMNTKLQAVDPLDKRV